MFPTTEPAQLPMQALIKLYCMSKSVAILNIGCDLAQANRTSVIGDHSCANIQCNCSFDFVIHQFTVYRTHFTDC